MKFVSLRRPASQRVKCGVAVCPSVPNSHVPLRDLVSVPHLPSEGGNSLWRALCPVCSLFSSGPTLLREWCKPNEVHHPQQVLRTELVCVCAKGFAVRTCPQRAPERPGAQRSIQGRQLASSQTMQKKCTNNKKKKKKEF